jgi:uncharacterized protein (UPF0333 family)
MDEKAQGAFEYILLLAGILLIVILVVVILRTSVLGQANSQIRSNVNAYANLTGCTGPFFNNSAPGFLNVSQVNCGGQLFNVT